MRVSWKAFVLVSVECYNTTFASRPTHRAHQTAGRAFVDGCLLDYPLGLLQGQLHHLDDLVVHAAATYCLVHIGHLAVVHGMLGIRRNNSKSAKD